MKFAPIAATLAAVVLSACASTGTGTAANAGIAQGEWKSATGITLLVEDGRLSGRAGCNRFTGTAKVEDGRLVTGPLAATKMMCSPDLMKAEAELFAFLDSKPTVTRQGDRTLILSSGDHQITLTR